MAHKKTVKYPYLREASRNMGYDFSYIWRVLEGKPGYSGRPGLTDDFWAESERLTIRNNKKILGGQADLAKLNAKEQV